MQPMGQAAVPLCMSQMERMQCRMEKMMICMMLLHVHNMNHVYPKQKKRNHNNQEQTVFNRVPTAGHPVTETTASIPPFPKTQREDNISVDADGNTVLGSFDLKWLIVRVDLRSSSSPFKTYSLPRSRSNNLTMLRRVMFRAA